jgi:Ni/Fe-hydrogenase subunit HybB-like protein
MKDRADLDVRTINHDLLDFPLHWPLWFFGGALLLGVFVALGLITAGFLILVGVGVMGIDRPAMWAFLITNFVFWVGISHAGVMISAILRLCQAEWRRPVTRAAEVLTVFALATAAIFPFLHTGRQWRTMYWAFPYDFWRGIWPDVRSPLIWDPSAIFTYLTGSTLFLYVALLPDLAFAREHARGAARQVYAVLSLGFRGTLRQWRLQALAGILLSALILPVFVSVHSIVSWDFAVALVPGWHSTVFAPYFVAGAVHSGVSAVATVMVVMRRLFRLEKYVTPDHFDAIGRLLVPVACGWLYFWWMDFYFGIYSRAPDEIAVQFARTFVYPYNVLTAIFLLAGFFIPVPLLLFRRVRRSITTMFWLTLLVNVGMWLERFIIIVPALTYKQPFSFSWTEFTPTWADWLMTLFPFGLVLLGVLTFAKFLPIIPLYDIKEGQTVKAEVQIGRVKVPAVVRE